MISTSTSFREGPDFHPSRSAALLAAPIRPPHALATYSTPTMLAAPARLSAMIGTRHAWLNLSPTRRPKMSVVPRGKWNDHPDRPVRIFCRLHLSQGTEKQRARHGCDRQSSHAHGGRPLRVSIPAEPGALDDEPLKAAEGPLSRPQNAEAISRSIDHMMTEHPTRLRLNLAYSGFAHHLRSTAT